MHLIGGLWWSSLYIQKRGDNPVCMLTYFFVWGRFTWFWMGPLVPDIVGDLNGAVFYTWVGQVCSACENTREMFLFDSGGSSMFEMSSRFNSAVWSLTDVGICRLVRVKWNMLLSCLIGNVGFWDFVAWPVLGNKIQDISASTASIITIQVPQSWAEVQY